MSSELRALWEHAGGRLPDSCAIVPLESLLRDNKGIAVGVMYPGPDTVGGVPLVKVGDIDSGVIPLRPTYCISAETNHEYRRTQLDGDELLITLVGNPGECVVVTPEMRGWNPARAIAVIRLRDTSLRTYLKAVLESSAGKHLIDAVLNTTVQKTLNLKDIRRLPIPLPPRETIEGISGLSDALTGRITLLRATNATFEAIAQALFKSWFVDFDPVRAKSQGLAPAGMDEATAALFPDRVEESALGPLPRGWRAPALAEAVEINPLRSLRRGAVAKYLEMAGVPTSGHSVGSVAVRAFGSGTKFRNGDTLLARITPCLENGKTAFVDFLADDEVGWGSTEFIVLRPRAPLPEYWAYLLCRHAPFREFAERSMSGTSGRQRVQNDVLGTFRIAVPPADVAKAFESIVAPLQQTIAGNYERAATLASLRDTLLPRLISGQLRLPLAQEAIAEATHAD